MNEPEPGRCRPTASLIRNEHGGHIIGIQICDYPYSGARPVLLDIDDWGNTLGELAADPPTGWPQPEWAERLSALAAALQAAIEDAAKPRQRLEVGAKIHAWINEQASDQVFPTSLSLTGIPVIERADLDPGEWRLYDHRGLLVKAGMTSSDGNVYEVDLEQMGQEYADALRRGAFGTQALADAVARVMTVWP